MIVGTIKVYVKSLFVLNYNEVLWGFADDTDVLYMEVQYSIPSLYRYEENQTKPLVEHLTELIVGNNASSCFFVISL